MDRNEAHESLEIVRQASELTRQAVARAGSGYMLIIWGVVWLVGFLGSQFLGEAQGYLWLFLDVFGIVGTAVVIIKSSKQVRSTHGKRIGIFWLILFVYGGLIYWIAGPFQGDQYLLFITILVSLAYVVMGLWFSPPLLYIGLSITALAMVGWQLVPAYLGAWLALVGGGGLISSGIYILRSRV
ncbi:MAG: hypothetical protein MUP44_09335 [Anaerolineales bacterium]|nr:hypothetical protein [Anaerolineales bacterium]